MTTLCGPGELIDVVITERGIAINPLRKDSIESVRNSGLPWRFYPKKTERGGRKDMRKTFEARVR